MCKAGMCKAGDVGKVRRGSEQDRVREERIIFFRASKHFGSQEARTD